MSNDLFENATDAQRHDKAFALACFSQPFYARTEWMEKYYPEEYVHDREMAFAVMCNYDNKYEKFVGEEFLEDLEMAKEVLDIRKKNRNMPSLYDLPQNLLDSEEYLRSYFDSDYIREAKLLGNTFRKISERIWDSEDFVEYAMSMNKEAYFFCSKRLKLDRDYTLRLVKQGLVDSFIMFRNFNDDDEIAGYILPVDPDGYIYLSKRLRAKKELADVAANNMTGTFMFMEYAPEEFRDNLDYAFIRLKIGKWSEYQYFSERIRARKDIALLALEKGEDPCNLEPDLYHDREMVDKALEINKEAYKYFPAEMRNDAQITLRAYDNTFPYIKETCYDYDDHAGCPDRIESEQIGSLSHIGSQLKANREFTEKLVNAFLKTKQSNGFTKGDLMKDFQTFYERIDNMVWKESRNMYLRREYENLKLN